MAERSVLITGCSSGIGLCAAQTLKARGWRVFATARKPEDTARLKAEVGVESLYLDYAEPASIAAAAEYVLAATDGTLTALFNNEAHPPALSWLLFHLEIRHRVSRRRTAHGAGRGWQPCGPDRARAHRLPFRGTHPPSLPPQCRSRAISASRHLPGPHRPVGGGRPASPSSLVLRPWPPSSCTRWKAPGQNLATTSPFPLTPWPCSAGSFLPAPSTPWPGGTRVSGEDERRGRTGV